MKPSSTNSRTLNSKCLLIMLRLVAEKTRGKRRRRRRRRRRRFPHLSLLVLCNNNNSSPRRRPNKQNKRRTFLATQFTSLSLLSRTNFLSFFSVFSLFLANQSRKIIGFTRAVFTFFFFKMDGNLFTLFGYYIYIYIFFLNFIGRL